MNPKIAFIRAQEEAGLKGLSDATWKDLTKEEGAMKNWTDQHGYLQDTSGWDRITQDKEYLRNIGALKDFYSQQDSKYAGTADAEKRRYNSIMEILDQQNKLEQGFKVRG